MRILLVDDEEISRRAIANFLVKQLEHDVTECGSAEEALDLMKGKSFPIVITYIRMPGLSGMDLLHSIKSSFSGKNTRVILITGFADVATAVRAFREGAADYLRKPLNVEELASVIEATERELEQPDIEHESEAITKPVDTDKGIKPESGLLREGSYLDLPEIGRFGIFSPQMREIVKLSLLYHQDRTVPVLIEGETGTGKELIARLVHYGDGDLDQPFISINCSAISPGLFESELFGYESGAFTGASRSGYIGKIELAQSGTLLLDEIGDLPLDIQPKLLRVLQERDMYRIGSKSRIKLDIRIICATNRDLEQLVSKGKFREDLFYRLNLGTVKVPPLREQKQAIAPLAQMFLIEISNRKNRRFRSIGREAVEMLEGYGWPGNVRELHNVIERVGLLYDEYEVLPEHLSFMNVSASIPGRDHRALRQGYLVLPNDHLDINSINSEIVEKALKKFGGNKSRTAEYLGITRSALRSRMKK